MQNYLETTTHTNKKGFSLLEVLLTAGIFVVLIGVSSPAWMGYYVGSVLRSDTANLVDSLERAKVLARSGYAGMTDWGVYVDSSNVTIFQGTSYSLRDTSYDEVTPINSTMITPSGDSEIVFESPRGMPVSTKQMVLTSSANNSRTISINETGLVSISYD